MNLLITGTPGSGKTSLVAYAAQHQDKRFVDADEIAGLCEWREFDSGDIIGSVDTVKINGGDNWYKKHGWYWCVDRLNEFLSSNPSAVICGSSENISGCYKLFDKVVILRKTKVELLSNLQSPERLNPFGKTTVQRAGFMEWQDHLITEAQPYDAMILDGNSIEDTYQTIVGILTEQHN